MRLPIIKHLLRGTQHFKGIGIFWKTLSRLLPYLKGQWTRMYLKEQNGKAQSDQ